jgi:hypothetical protein
MSRREVVHCPFFLRLLDGLFDPLLASRQSHILNGNVRVKFKRKIDGGK